MILDDPLHQLVVGRRRTHEVEVLAGTHVVFPRVRVVDIDVGIVFVLHLVRRLGTVAHRNPFHGDNAVEVVFLVLIDEVVQVVLIADERQQVVVGHHRVVGGVVEGDAVLGFPSRHPRVAGQCAVQVLHHAAVRRHRRVDAQAVEVAEGFLCHHQFQLAVYVVAVVLVEHLPYLVGADSMHPQIAQFVGIGEAHAVLTHIAERIVDIVSRVLVFLVMIALGFDEVDDARPQERPRQIVLHLVLPHKGVAVAHALQDEGHDDGHRHGGLLVLRAGVAVVGLAVVVHVVAQVAHRVVGAVAAHRTGKVQLVGQTVLLDEAVGGQRHGAALRIAHAHALPVVLEVLEREKTLVLIIQRQSVAHGIHHLSGRQLLIQVGVRTVLGHAVALVVGQDDQTAGLAHGIVACVVDEHAYVGHP